MIENEKVVERYHAARIIRVFRTPGSLKIVGVPLRDNRNLICTL